VFCSSVVCHIKEGTQFVFENCAEEIFGPKTEALEKLRSDEVHSLYSSSHYWDDEVREGGLRAE
jgi:hypothetical protein